MQQLAMFAPINPARDDEELDEYRCVCPCSLSLNAYCFIARVLRACRSVNVTRRGHSVVMLGVYTVLVNLAGNLQLV